MKNNERFELTVALKKVRTHTGKRGEYTRITCRTKDGKEYDGVHWDGAIDAEEGSISTVHGVVDIYNNEVQLNIKKITPAADQDCAGFLPSVPDDENRENLRLIGESTAEISHHGLRGFVRFCIKKNSRLFVEGTSAIQNHHALRRGYVKHVAEMLADAEMSIAEYIGVYEADENGELLWRHCRTGAVLNKQDGRQLDADLVRAAIPLHDWGKLYEYETRGAAFAVTNIGKLMSHPGITPWKLGELRMEYHQKLMDSLDRDADDAAINDNVFGELMHVIGSHHGKLEYCALSPPKTVAAMIVHIADYKSCFMDVVTESAYEEKGERGDFTNDRRPNPDGWQAIMRS